MRNQEVARKNGVITLAARPRNHENAVKSMTCGLAAFFVAVHAAKKRKENREPRRNSMVEGIYFAERRRIACLLGDA
jgi:hypothetical protein